MVFVANEINFDENMLENVEESIEIHEKVINSTDNILKLLNTYEYNFNFRLPI